MGFAAKHICAVRALEGTAHFRSHPECRQAFRIILPVVRVTAKRLLNERLKHGRERLTERSPFLPGSLGGGNWDTW